MRLTLVPLALTVHVASVIGRCYEPSPAFPLPSWSQDAKHLDTLFESIGASLKHAVSHEEFATSSFSVEVTSSEETLWSSHHTARERNDSRVGAEVVDGSSVYRIASITKTFTTLGVLQQQVAGNLSLDDAITKFIGELEGKQAGTIPWKDITLRTLASQLSGIPREFSQSDLANGLEDPTIVGLPPISRKGLIRCGEYADYDPCSRQQLLDSARAKTPVFAPKQKSSYSNVAFILLGLAIENVTGLPYGEYISQAILRPLGMNSSSFVKPDDSVAVLPKGGNYWDVEQGIARPTGGLYSSSTDLSKYIRYVLTHYNGITPALNWMQPASWSTSINSFYGVPWEIFRTSKILPNTQRPVTFVTKSGGEPAYFSIIIIAPDYDLGVTILVGGNAKLLEKLRELVTIPLIRAAENVAVLELQRRYAGTYVSTNSTLNSSLTLSASPFSGLTITEFISNGTDVLASPLPAYADPDTASRPWHAQLTPTLLYRNQTALDGEIWRMMITLERLEHEEEENVWDEFCITNIDVESYAGVALNEIVFWNNGAGDVAEAELPAFRVTLKKQAEKDASMETEWGREDRHPDLLVQG